MGDGAGCARNERVLRFRAPVGVPSSAIVSEPDHNFASSAKRASVVSKMKNLGARDRGIGHFDCCENYSSFLVDSWFLSFA